MPFPSLRAQHLRVDPLAVVAHPHPKLPLVVAKLDFDLLGSGMTERIAQCLAGDAEDLVAHDRMQRPRRTLHLDPQTASAEFSAASSSPSARIESARSFISVAEVRSPCTASRPSVIASAAWSMALARTRFDSAGRSGRRLNAVWNRSSSPWKLCNNVSCSSRAMRVRSATRASNVILEALAQLPHAQLIASPSQGEDQHEAQRAEPCRLVVSRGDVETERIADLVPYPAVVAGDDSKAVAAGCKIRILHLSLIGDFLPVRILAFELVTKADPIGHREAERGELDLEIADHRRKSQARGGHGGQVLPVELAIRGNPFDVHRRRQPVV